jgi:hypothetical protein
MRVFSSAGAVVAYLTIALGSALPTSSDANPPPHSAAAAPARTQGHAAAAPRHRRPGAFVTGCNSSNGSSLIGIPDQSDYAGGYAASVVAGQYNQACDEYTIIGGGVSNVIGGAGEYNETSGYNSFAGAGLFNYAQGNSSFVGGGGQEYNATAQAAVPGGNNVASGVDSFVGAGDQNQVFAAGNGSFIGAGGYQYTANGNPGAGNQIYGIDSFIGGGDLNQVAASGNGSFIGAGGYEYALNGNTTAGNQIYGLDSFIGAGDQNFIGGNYGVVVGGANNTVAASSGYSAIVGGSGNSALGGLYNFIGAGFQNHITGQAAFVGAGDSNSVSASEAFEGGGSANTIASTAAWGTLVGGKYNVVTGTYATIPGGASNAAAGELSFAAGYHADATKTGSFVWSDYVAGSSVVKDTAADQFVVRASGGTYIYSSENLHSGVELVKGSGMWGNLSDRNAKTDIAPLNDAAVLAKVAALPISTWRYKTEAGARHVGPMAQDFYAAFGVGEDDRHITSIYEDGVALAAIKALHAENAALRRRLVRDETSRAREDARLASLEQSVARLTRGNVVR